MSYPRFNLSTPVRLWGLLLLALALGLYACPPAVSGDDDPVQPDDDDDDDDDTGGGSDDDDFTIPEGLPIGGNLLWQVNDGEVPAGHVRVGLFPLETLGTTQADSFGALVSEEGLSSGNTIFTVYIKGEPPAAEINDFVSPPMNAAIYVPFAYLDDNQGSSYDAGELLLGASTALVVFIEDVVPFPSELSDLGAGPGWNLLDAGYLDGTAMEFTHVPDGTNSSNGPSIRTELLPDMGGSIQVRTEVTVPVGGVAAAWYVSPASGTASSADEQFVTPASNDSGAGATLLSWSVEGAPPSIHVGALPPPVAAEPGSTGGGGGPELSGALYQPVAYFDDGDLTFTAGTCDTLLAVGEGRPLVWLEPSTLTLQDAFALQREGQALGWSLFDESLSAWRPFAVGIDLVVAAVGDDDDSGGDDDDSAGDDDDSAGDDDDSAGGGDGPQIPLECLGDDDDSAGPGPGGGTDPPVVSR